MNGYETGRHSVPLRGHQAAGTNKALTVTSLLQYARQIASDMTNLTRAKTHGETYAKVVLTNGAGPASRAFMTVLEHLQSLSIQLLYKTCE